VGNKEIRVTIRSESREGSQYTIKTEYNKMSCKGWMDLGYNKGHLGFVVWESDVQRFGGLEFSCT